MRKRLPSIWREDHQNFRKRKRLLPIEEYMETSIQKMIFREMQSPWTDRYMERKARFYDFLMGGTNSKGIRYRDLALKGRHALHKKEREKGGFWRRPADWEDSFDCQGQRERLSRKEEGSTKNTSGKNLRIQKPVEIFSPKESVSRYVY